MNVPRNRSILRDLYVSVGSYRMSLVSHDGEIPFRFEKKMYTSTEHFRGFGVILACIYAISIGLQSLHWREFREEAKYWIVEKEVLGENN